MTSLKSEVSLEVPVGAPAIYAVLADGWSYSSWVVGNAHIRDVDPEWPAPGSRIHHSVGAWPVNISDTTVVRDSVPDRLIDLEAKLWLLGTARVRISLEPLSGSSTRVVMQEGALSGPGRLMPDILQRLLLGPRNAEALSRLADFAVGRARQP
ncbi:SRPBCC family protein [Amycolatopsis sp. 195334CR]|uniref:SRPBCC family protein n=1 Tax=Amycolatopsis sp. 195334CR TaxID=2814588 RepID=UPI001A8BF954|nr:SRPBCC family protein [Amycolatopsis sp. 195334CR]MBN6039024.1 SRPBCC family protein [Amycolatopsis sp. 195334CR]